MLGIGQAGGIAEMAGFHAQPLGLAVHHLREDFFAAGHAFGQRHTGIVAGLDDHALDQVFNLHLRIDADKHFRALGAPGFFGNQ